jgi:hypothetical protein
MFDLGHAAVEQIVRQTNQGALFFCHQGIDGFVWVKEPLPSYLRDVLRKRRITVPTVERVVAIPERALCGVVFWREGPNGWCRHCLWQRGEVGTL